MIRFISDKDLFTPGPTMTPSSVKNAYLNTSMYHRSPEFEKVVLFCSEKLKPYFGASTQPLLLSSSGTGAMEAAVVNLTMPQDKVLVINAGKFGERWKKLCEAYQCEVIELSIAPGQSFKIEELERLLKSAGTSLSAVFFQAHETSTGTLLPVASIAKSIKSISPNSLIVVDAISCLGVHQINMDQNGIDCVVSGSQKGFGVGPGLSFIAISNKAWSQLSARPKFYFDLAKEKKGQATGRTAFTPPINLILGLEAALKELEEMGGVDQFIQHHAQLAKAMRASVKAMGLEFFVNEDMRSNVLTTIKVPGSLDGVKVLSTAKSRYGAVISGGQDELKGKIIRFAHLGFMNQFQLLRGISALEFALSDEGWKFELGGGVASAMKAFQGA